MSENPEEPRHLDQAQFYLIASALDNLKSAANALAMVQELGIAEETQKTFDQIADHLEAMEPLFDGILGVEDDSEAVGVQ